MALYTYGGTPADVLTDTAGNVVPDWPVLVRTAGTGALVSALFEVDGVTPIGELRTNPVTDSQPGAIRPFKADSVTEIEYEYLDGAGNPVRWYQAAREMAQEARDEAAAALTTAEAALPLTGGTLTGKLQSEAAEPGSATYAAFVAEDVYDRWRVDAGGGMAWGSGAAARDTTLARTGPGEVTIGGRLVVTGGVDGAAAAAGTYSVTAYGAVGDGVADDAPAVQAALDAAAVDGGQVVVPPGEYKLVTLPLRIYRHTRLTLMPGARFVRGVTGTLMVNGDAGQLLGEYTGHGDLVIEGGVWDMRATDNPTDPDMCISIGHAERVTIRDLTILDVGGYHAIELNSTRFAVVERCEFLGYVDTGGRAGSEAVQIDLAGRSTLFGAFGPYDHTVCRDVVVRDCYVGASGTVDTVAWPSAVGSHSTTAGHPHQRITVDNCTFEGGAEYAVKAYCWDDSVIARNRIVGCGGGIWFRTLDSTKVADRTDENDVDTNASAPNTGAVIAKNTVRDCTGYGDAIRIEGEATGKWSDVSIRGNIVVGTVTTHGVRLFHADHCTVKGNRIREVGGTGVSTQSCTFGSITANAVYDCGASWITADTDTDMLIADNQLALCGTHGLWAFSSARLKVTDNWLRGAGRTGTSNNGVRVTSSTDRLTLTGNTYQAWGSGTEAGTAIYLSSTVTGVRRFGNDVLGQATTEITDLSVSPNLSPYDAGTP